MSSGIWISTGFLPGWLLRRAGLSPGSLRAPCPPLPRCFGTASALVGLEDGAAAGVEGAIASVAAWGTGGGATSVSGSSKIQARSDDFLAITQPRFLPYSPQPLSHSLLPHPP